ncbi:INO80 complex subunit D-like [Pistacia vera]|uniref:INO80 complex subunit D-like n=1 Tax=Pistacia vera TaxID=55513 RepID=UPI001262DBF2|nr:INO80 complex subunit D-like [Pistacia vera]XP_031283888.1 INO80 complex subunit D-like [Pistacia vera]
MSSAPKNLSSSSSSSKPPKIPISRNPNPNPNPKPKPRPVTFYREDMALARASHLTRHQLLRRRAFFLRQLSRCYRDHYWALMEELKIQYKQYYWNFGVSPLKEINNNNSNNNNNDNDDKNIVEGSGENVNNNISNSSVNNNNNGNNNNNLNINNNNSRCLFVGCKLKAMALTSFCHLHILSDSKQKLYKPCDYVIKSAQAGPITCGKPILRSTVPALCTVHFQKAQKHVTRALKKAGLNVSSSSKLAPKFHVIVAEYIRQIQA